METLRDCLLDALKAIKRAKPPINSSTAFQFLSRYVPRCADRDEELAKAFKAANASMEDLPPQRGRRAKRLAVRAGLNGARGK